MDPVFLATWGLPGLFIAAFLSGSVVPLPSEAVLVALVGGGLDLPPLVAIATAGNVLGAATLYWIGLAVANGRGGAPGEALLRRLERDPAAFDKARARLRRWGPPLLLLTWVPIVGDLFVVAAGFGGVRLLPFLAFTAVGKMARFAAVASAAAMAIDSLA